MTSRGDLVNARSHVIQAITFLKASDGEVKTLIDALHACSRRLERSIERMAKASAEVSRATLQRERLKTAHLQDRDIPELDAIRERQELRMEKIRLTNGSGLPLEQYPK